ncbi:multidrug resistance pump protein (macronuclear) [Tetrahymena thermophila SB210]|uniref:Multidrug resistance pump protein n=1 Tax=Tetrahymena thermophila (strain SB210) TaxID=312017 RepID=A4VDH9_TETTS|nr:multidrug resistance pump protein [Tetrahymena thermophila SB210]EDK31584.2 multidrug resistance pump protein [Tetrahymena thermophila SB210]|eukprot:XP_001471411.2 multidrug resistance pump protein [Tetrahymena thermophila SB210]
MEFYACQDQSIWLYALVDALKIIKRLIDEIDSQKDDIAYQLQYIISTIVNQDYTLQHPQFKSLKIVKSQAKSNQILLNMKIEKLYNISNIFIKQIVMQQEEELRQAFLKKEILIQELKAENGKDLFSFLTEEELTKQNVISQICELIINSLPNTVLYLSIFYYNFVNMFFVKQFGNYETIASFGMGVTWFNSTTLCFIVSLGNGFFIQSAQAFGAKNFQLMAELYQKCQAILFFFGIISTFFLLNTQSILISFGISEEVSTITQQFSYSAIPSIISNILNESTRQLLISQKIFDIPMKVQILVYFFHPIWCYLFSIMLDLGIYGIGFSRAVSEMLGFILLRYQIKQKHLCDEVWDIPYRKQFLLDNWIPFLKISIPVGALLFLEWIFSEIQIILVGMLKDDKQLAGQSSFSSIILFFAMCPLGLSQTSNSYLGNAIGQGKKKVCINFSKITIVACFVEVALMILIGILLQDFFAGVFSTDPEMEYYFRTAYNMYIYMFILAGCFQFVLSGILRCCENQNYAAQTFLISYYLIGLPLACFLIFKFELGIKGVWISQSLSAWIVSISCLIKYLNMDWDDQILKVQKRVQLEIKELDIEMPNIMKSN